MNRAINAEKGIRPFGLIIAVYVLFLTIKMTGSIIPINLYLISAVTLIIGIVYYLHRVQIQKVVFDQRLITFWLFVVYCMLTLIWSRDLQYGEQKLFIVASTLFISTLVCELVVKRTDRFLWWFCLFSLSIVIWYLFNYGLNRIDIGSQDFRLDLKTGLNPIVIGQYFGFSILSFIFLSRFKKKTKVFRLLLGGVIGILIILIFLTGSKGPMLALGFSLVLPYVIARGFRVKFTLKFIFFVIVMLVFFLYLISPLLQGGNPSALSTFIQRRFLDTGDTSGSISGRMIYLSIAFKHILSRSPLQMIFGNGLGDFGFVFDDRFQANYPHNIFVELLYEEGLLGMGLFLFLIYSVIRINFKQGRRLFSYKYEGTTLYYFLSLFYFSLFASMTSGDIAANFFVFVSILFVYKATKRVRIKPMPTHIESLEFYKYGTA